MRRYTFIDLFAGLEGFHIALRKIAAKGVFASEISKEKASPNKKGCALPVKFYK